MPKSTHPVPFVEWFINNSPLPRRYLEGLREYADLSSPKMGAMLLLREATMGLRRPQEALQAAELYHQEEFHPDMEIIFCTLWIYAITMFSSSRAEIQVLANRIEALTTDETPPEVMAWGLFVRGSVCMYQGNTIVADKLTQQAIDLIDLKSPHYNPIQFHYYCSLMYEGRAGSYQLNISLDDLGQGEEFDKALKILKLVNSATSGSLENTLSLVKDIENNPIPIAIIHRVPLEVAKGVVYLMHKHTAGLGAGAKDPVIEQIWSEACSVPWVLSTRALLDGDTEEALKWARIHAYKGEAQHSTNIGFDEYCLIRAELSSGNIDAARSLLHRRKLRGTYHYIDDLFLARVELLAGNLEAASMHWAKLEVSIERYVAQGRLDFEIKLALELSVESLSKLKSSARKLAKQSSVVNLTNALPTTTQQDVAANQDRFVCVSPQMESVRNMIMVLSQNTVPVLVTGETGTGKEVIARSIHSFGPRHKKPFIAVNCGAIPESLFESELFGHQRGAFTGAQTAQQGLFRQAGDGTIFLDEIGEIPPRLQVTLLRVLESGEVRPVGGDTTYTIACRVLAATNADLEEMSNQGTFRRDLYFRLQRMQLNVPALRDRPDDIIPLAEYFLDRGRFHGEKATMSNELKELLVTHVWPGNVRELRNVIERMRLMHSDKLAYTENDILLKVHSHLTPANKKSVVGRESNIISNLQTEASADLMSSPVEERPSAEDKMLAEGNSTLRRLDRLRGLFKKHRKLKVFEVAQLLEVTPSTASRYLKTLAKEKLIERIEPTKSRASHYYALCDND